MKRNKVLIFGATSDLAQYTIKKLLSEGTKVFAVSRHELNLEDKNLVKLKADLSFEHEINYIFSTFKNEIFDSVICFQGVAISSPVEFLKREELQKQLDISLFSLLTILKNLRNKLSKNALVINISSMAAFGLFPFLSPYTISKSASDELLYAYEIETGIKTVSIKPGVIGTKFWRACVDINKCNFENFKEEYAPIGDFYEKNALKNSGKGLKPKDVSKLVYKILKKKNPKSSYLIGADSYFTAFMAKFKGRFLTKLIRKFLKARIKYG